MKTTGSPWIEERARAFARMAEHTRRRVAASRGPFTSNPEPPGDGWHSVLLHKPAFAAAGLCELWRMDLNDETRFGRFSDFPPGFDWACMMWRPAS